MTAAETIALVADVLRVRFVGWKVVEGPNHDPIDHGLEVVLGGSEVVGHRGGQLAVRDQIVIRLAVSTAYDYATVLAGVDTLALAAADVAAQAKASGAESGPLTMEAPSIVDDEKRRMYWYVEARIALERPLGEPSATAVLKTIAQACEGTF